MEISILGCGWLGFPLAKELLEKDHVVKASTTTTDKMNVLSHEGIIPYLIKILDEGVQGDLSSFLTDTEVLIVNIPPGFKKSSTTNLLKRMERLKAYIEKSDVKRVLLVSSTSVYDDREEFPVYTERDAPNALAENSRQLRAVENLIKNSQSYTTGIVRFGGLFGPERHPVNSLSGRKQVKNPDAPVNLIHQKDCIGIILKIIENEAWGETYNAVYPEHPAKEEFYSKLARKKNLALPEFDHVLPSKGKIIESVNIGEFLDYKFEKPIY